MYNNKSSFEDVVLDNCIYNELFEKGLQDSNEYELIYKLYKEHFETTLFTVETLFSNKKIRANKEFMAKVLDDYKKENNLSSVDISNLKSKLSRIKTQKNEEFEDDNLENSERFEDFMKAKSKFSNNINGNNFMVIIPQSIEYMDQDEYLNFIEDNYYDNNDDFDTSEEDDPRNKK